jgi:hypothetical protein
VAGLAAYAQEALLQTPALQISVELLLHVVGQLTTFPCPQFPEIRTVLLDYEDYH